MAGCLTTNIEPIILSCADRQAVGGATGRKWIGRVSDLAAAPTVDANGMVTGITLLAGKRLTQAEGIKNKENFSTELLETEGGQSLYTLTAALQVPARTQAQRANINKMRQAEDFFVIGQTNEGQFEVIGIENGASVTAFSYSTGTEFGANTFALVSFTAVEGEMQRLCLIGGTAAATIAALDALALQEPTYTSASPSSISSASGGLVTITGTNLAEVTAAQFGSVVADGVYPTSDTTLDVWFNAGTPTVQSNVDIALTSNAIVYTFPSTFDFIA